MSNKANRLKILHVIPSVAPCRGGPSNAVLEMVAALRRRDIDAEIATTNDNGTSELNVKLDTLVTHRGVPVRFFQRYSSRLNALREHAYSASFKVWLQQHIHQYDAVHVHAVFSYCSSYAMSLARKRSTPYVVRPIGQLEDWSLAQSKLKKALYLRLLEKANIEAANSMHFTSESEKNQALKRFTHVKPCVIPLGTHVPELLPDAAKLAFDQWQIHPDTPCLVYLSRLHPKKGLELLIHALAKLAKPRVQLIIAGDGEPSYVRGLRDLCTSLSVDKQCRFIGFVKGEQKNIILQRADLFCLTSYSENFGVAVIEAMANGTAPLISRHVALANPIAKNALGFVCDLDESTISDNLLSALTDLERANRMGSDAREFVAQHYDWSVIAPQLEELYKRITR